MLLSRPSDAGAGGSLTHLVGLPEPDVEGRLAQALYGLRGEQVLERTGGVSLRAEPRPSPPGDGVFPLAPQGPRVPAWKRQTLGTGIPA